MKNEFPNIKGFSTTNLWYMKKWYMFYAGDDAEKLQQLVGEIEAQIPMIQPRMELLLQILAKDYLLFKESWHRKLQRILMT